MSYTYWEIKHTPFVDNGWDSGSEVTLGNYHKLQLRTLLGEGRDNFSFKLNNVNGDYNNYFNPNDRIIISRAVNSTTFADSDIIMAGTVKDVPQTETSRSDSIKVEGYNFSESVMSALVFVDLTNKNIPTALEDALLNATGKNPNFKVTWHPDNPTLKSDNTAFPTITSEGRHFNKPLKKIIEKYSTNTSTEDGTYYWYVDKDNKFVWRHENNVDEYTFNAGTDEHKALKIGRDIKGVKNYIILKGGIDPQGNQIQTRYINWSSVSVNGTKFHFLISETNNARDLVYRDLVAEFGTDGVGNNSYPTFPFTSTWVSAAVDTTVTATDENEYIEVVRAHIKAALKEEGKRFAESRQYGKLEVDITFRAGSKTWGLGDKINCTIPTIRAEPFLLRVSEKMYGDDTDVYTLEEDEGTIGKA